jgi:hypothetical protein
MNLPLAAHYSKLTAEQGHPTEQAIYGVALINGDSVSLDTTTGARSLKLATIQGQSDTRWAYGQLLQAGLEVRQDASTASCYFKVAAGGGSSKWIEVYRALVSQSGEPPPRSAAVAPPISDLVRSITALVRNLDFNRASEALAWAIDPTAITLRNDLDRKGIEEQSPFAHFRVGDLLVMRLIVARNRSAWVTQARGSAVTKMLWVEMIRFVGRIGVTSLGNSVENWRVLLGLAMRENTVLEGVNEALMRILFVIVDQFKEEFRRFLSFCSLLQVGLEEAESENVRYVVFIGMLTNERDQAEMFIASLCGGLDCLDNPAHSKQP